MPTAEEAAAANLAWRAVNAPSTVTSAEQAQASQYRSQYYNVERPAQQARDAAIQQTIYQNRQMINAQEGLSYAGTHTQAQLAALSGSAAVGRQAYEQERSYYESAPSAEFLRIQGEYSARRNAIVSSSGISYPATGWMSLNTTAGAGEYTGRAAEYKAAYEREVYGIGAPDSEQEYYRRAAERAVVERAGYTAPAELGDIRTQQIRQGYGMFSQAVGLAGGEVASDYQMTGRIIETQRQAAYATPTRRDERFFMGELQKWAEIPVEQASAYHDIGMESGKAIPANPYEYQADLAVEFLKGSPDKASEFFSPVSGEMSRYLPGGQGVQEFAWEEAKTDYARQTGAAQTPYPERVSFMEGVTYLGAAEGKYGPYGKLAGGIDTGGVNLGGGRTSRTKVLGASPTLGINGETGGLVNFQEYYAGRQAAYASELKIYEEGGSSSKSMYNDLLSKRDELVLLGKANVGLEQSRYQANLLFTPITEADVVKTESKTTPQTGALPIVGAIPYVSPFLATFQPELTTTTKQYEAKGVFGGTVSASSVETSEGKVPFANMVSDILPELHERRNIGGGLVSEETKDGKYLIDIALSPVREFAKTPTGAAIVMGAVGPQNYATLTNPNLGKQVGASTIGPVTFVQGAIPMSPEWSKDTYENIRQDPMRGAASAAITVALVGVGTGAKVLGAGTKFATPTSSFGKAYQYTSTAASAGMIGMYGSDVLTRVTGSSLSQWVPIGQTKEQQGGGYFEGIQKRFPGWMESRKQLNVVETQELLPMSIAFKASQYVGDKVVGWSRTRGVPEIKNPKASGYTSEEGFPTNPNIKTQDLIDSFNTGVITSPKLSETTMAPTGEPLKRIPVGSQIGAPVGKTFIYTGAEYPFLQQGYVGESASELPALFAAPQRISYFTKAGESQMGGFGITSDILGIYRQPSVYRSVVKSGVYQEIPKEILNTPSVGSANDPLNPRNVAIGNWMRTEAKPGIPVITQYGKSEWQYLIPSGSATKEPTMTGWYRDAGQRIPQYDVAYTGKRSASYKPPSQVTSPIDLPFAPKGVPLREVGRAPMGISATSISTSSQRNVPISISSSYGTRISQKSYFKSISSSGYPSLKVTSPSGVSRQPYSSKYGYEFPYSGSSKGSSPMSSITSLISSKSGLSYSSKGYSSTPFTSSPISTSKPPSSVTTPVSTPKYTPSYTPETPSYTPPYTPTYTPDYTPPNDPLRGGGQLPGGGGGTRLYGNLGVRTWRRENLVATAEYLGRGMRDIGFGWGAGTGTYSEKTRMPKKRKATRRKKK